MASKIINKIPIRLILIIYKAFVYINAKAVGDVLPTASFWFRKHEQGFSGSCEANGGFCAGHKRYVWSNF
ncbi:hypothetical protein C4553_03815 [Candidatus Parcubacteria bacterium]|nr:MAG: hypothetical protein C4553_03815 [Candidatus Parcubacteria bacterium]